MRVGEPELDEAAEAAAFITWSTKPPGCSISDHMTAVTAGGSTYGAKITMRRNVRPGNLRFSSSAIPRLSGSWMTSDSTVMMKMCSIACRNTGSSNATR